MFFLSTLQIIAVTITLVSTLAMGASIGFTTTASIVYANPNTTTLKEILNENETSWIGI